MCLCRRFWCWRAGRSGAAAAKEQDRSDLCSRSRRCTAKHPPAVPQAAPACAQWTIGQELPLQLPDSQRIAGAALAAAHSQCAHGSLSPTNRQTFCRSRPCCRGAAVISGSGLCGARGPRQRQHLRVWQREARGGVRHKAVGRLGPRKGAGTGQLYPAVPAQGPAEAVCHQSGTLARGQVLAGAAQSLYVCNTRWQ